ncbi:DUF4241 domain-containing protein [Nocardiopsis sediminis]|uniref:DUF4241 domain-containing protein n=1 Tax=Nocardiopsis sediminis TaxID=1778267 RepID=A0ABV8FQ75_9ACTN
MSPRPPDIDGLFTDGRAYDLRHIREGLAATIRVVTGADLHLPSGRVVACEPATAFPKGAQRHAFIQRAEPGSYPVELAVADYHRSGPRGSSLPYVAAARIVVRDEPVAAWRLALLEGQDDTALAEDEFYGYPVDGGMGALGSPEAFDSPDAVEDLMWEADSLEDFDTAGVYTNAVTGHNVVFFHTGEGDGHYPTWVGYTAGGAVAGFASCFMTLSADR